MVAASEICTMHQQLTLSVCLQHQSFQISTGLGLASFLCTQGATRNYEPWRDQAVSTAEAQKAREEEEMGNAMRALENRTLDSKREMDIMAALDEVQTLNARHNK